MHEDCGRGSGRFLKDDFLTSATAAMFKSLHHASSASDSSSGNSVSLPKACLTQNKALT